MYVYVCVPCLKGDHEHCEGTRDIPKDPHMIGGGHCVCSHGEKHSAFEEDTRRTSIEYAKARGRL